MAELSPQAQAVRDAVLATYADSIPKDDNLWALERASAVAALRAAADQVVPLHICGTNATRAQTRLGIRHKLLALATELENQ